MNWLDALILIIFAVFMIKGMANGVIRESANLGGTILGILVAYYRSHMLAMWITEQTGLAIDISRILAFIAEAFLIAILVSFLGALLSNVVKATPARVFDAGGGVLLGGVKAFFVVCLILVVMVSVPWDTMFSAFDSSFLADKFLTKVPYMYNALSGVFGEHLPEGWLSLPGVSDNGMRL